MAFSFKKLTIPDVILVEPEVFGDSRGFFFEVYKSSQFIQAGIVKGFVQVNHSRSQKGVLRGLHYRMDPFAQGKLVRAIAGEIFDVAVDMRKGSPHYGKWEGVVLNSENRRLFYVPEGFAHGFCVLSDIAEVIYYCTQEYAPGYDRGIIWNDPQLAIKWALKNPILSKKDSKLPFFRETMNNFSYKM